MKLSALITVFCTVQLFAGSSYSQSANVTVNRDNATLGEIFRDVEGQSNFRFFYNIDQINMDKKLSIHASNVQLSDVLNNVLGETNVTYKVIDKYIVLVSKEEAGAILPSKVTGKVTDANSGEALPGVVVLLEGSNKAITTDANGKYSIDVPGVGSLLSFSFLGYEQRKAKIFSDSTLNITLQQEVTSLDEVVVVGYGVTKKSDVTGSVASVKTKDMSINATTSVDQMLQGRAAGLTLTSVSAQPGSRLNINIRGGTNPLYVIDGVPILNNKTAEQGINANDIGYSGGVDRDPLNSINPSDIESIDILKDASAAAIYGSAAADGVILITTKKGKAGKVSVEYKGSYTWQNPKAYFDLLDAQGFMIEHNRLGLDKSLFDAKSGMYGSKPASPYNPMFSQADIAAAGKGTNWLNEIMRDGSIQEHNISMSGGTDYTKIYASFNYFGNDAILKNSTFDRYSGRINFDQQLGDRIKFNSNITFSQINANNAAVGANNGGAEKYNMLLAGYAFSPTLPVRDSVGNFSRTFDAQITNPVAFLSIADYNRTSRFFANPNIEVKIIGDLKANIVGGMDRQTSNRYYYLPRIVQNVTLPSGMAQLLNSRIDNYSSEAYLTYNHQFGASNLTVVGGTGYYKTIDDGSGVQVVNFFTDAFTYNNIGVASDKLKSLYSSYRDESNKISQFFRANYSFNDKYILTIVGRRDGSSKFAPNKKYGFFPGASGAWRINKENFMESIPTLSDFKLRVGYGSAGNESGIGNYPSSLYNTGYNYQIGQTLQTGLAISQLGNPNLSWETDVTINTGIDLGLMANRVTASIDYFDKTKKDLLAQNLLLSNNPVGQIAANVGSQSSKGWEFSVTSNNLTGKFIWTTTVNLSSYNLTWLTRNPAVALSPWIKTKDPVNAIYGWKTSGIIKTASDTVGYVPKMTVKPYLGNIKYVDINHDGKLDEKDVVLLDDGTPKWSFGFNNTFRYMGVDLNIYIYGLIGGKAYNGYRGLLGPGGIADPIKPTNVLKDIKNVWSSDNPKGIYPGIASDPLSGNNPTLTSNNVDRVVVPSTDFWLMDATFARIKNITLGYTLPERLINRMKIKSLRLYGDLQNVYVLTKYKGVDPEVTEQNPYPQALSISVGLNVTF